MKKIAPTIMALVFSFSCLAISFNDIKNFDDKTLNIYLSGWLHGAEMTSYANIFHLTEYEIWEELSGNQAQILMDNAMRSGVCQIPEGSNSSGNSFLSFLKYRTELHDVLLSVAYRKFAEDQLKRFPNVKKTCIANLKKWLPENFSFN